MDEVKRVLFEVDANMQGALDGFAELAAYINRLGASSEELQALGFSLEAIQAVTQNLAEGMNEAQAAAFAAASGITAMAEATLTMDAAAMAGVTAMQFYIDAAVKMGDVGMANISTVDGLGQAISNGTTAMLGSAQMTDQLTAQTAELQGTIESIQGAWLAEDNAMTGMGASFVNVAEGTARVTAGTDAMGQAIEADAMIAETGMRNMAGGFMDSSNLALASLGAMDTEMGITTTEAEAAAVGMDTLGKAEQGAGEKAASANEEFGMSQYMLMMLGMMALTAGQHILGMGINFDDTMNIIQGKTRASDAQMQTWTETLKTMSTQGGYALDVLAQGLDIVTQAGFQAGSATEVLQQAMELARATGSDLVGSTNLLAASLNAYGQSSASAADYAQQLFAALADGKQNLQELAQMLGSTMDTAAAAGISFSDLVTAEALFTRSTTNSSMAAREFQSFIAAMAADTNLTAKQLEKLSPTIDAVKFATLDWAGKLEMLSKLSGDNVAQFNSLIGGTDAVKRAMDALSISTAQLSKNAKAAGLSFDPLFYNSLKTPAERLQYLTLVSGYNEAALKKLTANGVNPLNTALSNLDLKTSDVIKKFEQLHPKFDQAKFDSSNFKDQLLMLWEATGHNVSEFATFIGGTKNLGEAADIMGIKLTTGPAPKGFHVFRGVTADGRVEMQKLQGTLDTTSTKTLPSLSKAFDKTSADTKANLDKINGSLSQFGQAMDQVFVKSGLTDALGGLAKAINTVATQTGILTSIFDFFMGPTLLLTIAINNLGAAWNWLKTAVSNVIGWLGGVPHTLGDIATNIWNSIKKAFTSGAASVEQSVQSFIDSVIQKFIKFALRLVGASIVPDMIHAITVAFSNGGALWNSIIGSALSTIEATFNGDMRSIETTVQGAWATIGGYFNSARGTLTGLAQSIGSGVNSALSSAGTTWRNTVNSAVSSVIATVRSWIGAAISAGAAVGNAIGDGLNSAVGWVKQAASNIAGAISSILHHSTPEEGPLHGDDQWGQHFGDAFATGMLASMDKLRSASLQMASSIGPNLVVNTPALGGGMAGGGGSTVIFSQILTTLQTIARQQGSSNVVSGPSVTNSFSGTLFPGLSQAQLWQLVNSVGGLMMESGARGATQQGGRP